MYLKKGGGSCRPPLLKIFRRERMKKTCSICHGTKRIPASYDYITGKTTTYQPCFHCNGTGLRSEQLRHEKSLREYNRLKMWKWCEK